MSFKLKSIAFLLSLFLVFALTACGNNSASSEKDGTISEANPTNPDMFDNNDSKTEVDDKNATEVTLDGKTLTISKAGEYVISESIADGQIIVDSDKNSEVHLVLKGVSITSTSCAAIYVKKAKKVIITLADGTENKLKVSGEFTANGLDNLDGVIFSKSDLAINGEGSLFVSTNYGHGIVFKDNLVITGGKFNIDTSGHAFDGNDSLRISKGDFKIKTESDGVHVDNAENVDLGFFYASGGNFDITAGGDGISASGYVELVGGKYNITAGGGAENGEKAYSGGFGFYDKYNNSNSSDTPSTKAIKTNADLQISGGEFSLNSADDALHSNGNLTISGGSGTIATGDDGIHSDKALTLSGGKFNITKSYEGLEGVSITLSGGEHSIVSNDDGLNAGGGNDQSGFGGAMPPDNFGSSFDSFIEISGGKLLVNASGDGIDSNGSVTVSGGETYISGPRNSGNGALDFDGQATVTGGIFVAAGSSGMVQNFSSAKNQGTMLVNFDSRPAGTTVKVVNSSGKEIFSRSFEKDFSSVVISLPEIKSGETYTVTAGEVSVQVEMTALVYGSGGMGGFGGGGRPNGFGGGGRPDGFDGGGRPDKNQAIL